MIKLVKNHVIIFKLVKNHVIIFKLVKNHVIKRSCFCCKYTETVDYLCYNYFVSNSRGIYRIGGVIVSLLASSVVDLGFER